MKTMQINENQLPSASVGFRWFPFVSYRNRAATKINEKQMKINENQLKTKGTCQRRHLSVPLYNKGTFQCRHLSAPLSQTKAPFSAGTFRRLS